MYCGLSTASEVFLISTTQIYLCLCNWPIMQMFSYLAGGNYIATGIHLTTNTPPVHVRWVVLVNACFNWLNGRPNEVFPFKILPCLFLPFSRPPHLKRHTPPMTRAHLLRDWSLITGRGGATKWDRGTEVLPLQIGVGAEKVLAMLKGKGVQVLR